MLLMLVIMEYLNFGDWAKVQPGFGRCKLSILYKNLKNWVEGSWNFRENLWAEIIQKIETNILGILSFEPFSLKNLGQNPDF